nr:PAS domain S-box protein [Kineococcus siccus]
MRSAGFAAVFSAAVLLGRLTVMDGTSLSLVWPAAGVAVVWFCVQRSAGTRVLDLGLLAAATFTLNVVTGAPAVLGGAFVLANVVQVLVFEALFRRWCPDAWGAGGLAPLTGAAQLMRLVTAATLATGAGALVGPTAVWAVTGTWSWLSAVVWMTRNTVSILLIAGTAFRIGYLLAAGRSRPRGWPRGWRAVESTAVLVCSVLGYGLVFGVLDGLPVVFPLIALTAWVALRFDTTVVLVHGLVVGTAAVLLTLAGQGPFALVVDDPTRAVVVQVYVGVLTAVGLALALGRDERDALLARMADVAAVSRRLAAEAAAAQARAEQQQERAEAAAADAEARGELAQAVLESVDVGIVVAGADGRLLMFNRAAQEFHGLDADADLDPAEHAGRYDLFDADGVTPLAPSRVPLAMVLRHRTFAGAEIVIAPSGRPPIIVTCSGRRMTRADGTPLGAVVAMTDVTAQRQAQRALEAARREAAEQAELLQLIFDNVSDGIRVLDRDGEIRLNNAAVQRMLLVPGPGGTSAWGPDYGYFHADGARPVAREELPLVRAMSGDPVDDMVMVVRNELCPAGAVLSISARPLPGADGPRGAVAVFRDVTRETRQREALRRSEAELQRAFEASLVGNVHLALDGTVLRINAAGAAVLGRTPEEVVGRDWARFIHPDDLPARRTAVRAVLDGEEQAATGLVRHRHRDGRTVHSQVSTVVVRDEDGRPLHAASQLVDVSARVAAEDTLRRQRDVYARLLRALSDLGEGVLVEHGEQVTYVNDAFARLSGRSSATLLRLPTSLLLVPDGEHEAWTARKEPRAGSAGPVVTALRRPDGSTVPVEASTVRLAEAGDATLTIVRDLSGRVRDQAALAATREQLGLAARAGDDLVASLDRDLRQPLSTTTELAALLLDTWHELSEEEKRHHLTRIRRAGQWADDLLDDILTTARLDRGYPVPGPERVHVPALVADLLDRLGADAGAVDTAAVQDVTVLADRGHVERIVSTLLRNALEHGRPPVRVLARRRGEEVAVEVVDAGDGVAPQHVPQLFARSGRSAGTHEGRTGLGLGVARALAVAGGGDLTHRAAASGAAWFTLTLTAAGPVGNSGGGLLDRTPAEAARP